MSDGLWIIGPETLWVAEDHVLALADYLESVRAEIERVALAMPRPGPRAPLADESFLATVSWGEVRKLEVELTAIADKATRLTHALWAYAQSTATAERWRVQEFQASADRLLALMTVSFSGATPSVPFSQWGFGEAAQSIVPPHNSQERVSVLAHSTSGTVLPARTLADRVGRIPSYDQPPIRIERYAAADGSYDTEVFISGTRHFEQADSAEPFDMTSNIQLVAGATAASLVAVQRAMVSAGVSSTDRVLFVGHSQGGLIAARLAESGEYRISGLLTVGAPVGVVPVRGDYPAVHLAHSDDAVPGLAGHNASSKAIRVERASGKPPGDLVGAHSLSAYQESASVADASPASWRLGQFPVARGSSQVQYFSARRD